MRLKRFYSLWVLIFLISTFIPNFIDARRGGGGGGFSRRSSSSRSSSWSSRSSGSSHSSYSGYYSSGPWTVSDYIVVGIVFGIPGLVLLFGIGAGIIEAVRNSIRRAKENYKDNRKLFIRNTVRNVLIIVAIVIAFKYGGFLIGLGFIVVLFILISKLKKYKSSLVFFQFGFYLGEGNKVEEIKGIIENCDVDNTNSLYNMLVSINKFVESNSDAIRWYDYSIEHVKDSELESKFNEKMNEERGKYEEEEMINVEGRKDKVEVKSDNLEEIFVVSIIGGFFADVPTRGKTLEETLKTLKYVSNISIDNFGGVSVWYNIMDREELIEAYPEIKSV